MIELKVKHLKSFRDASIGLLPAVKAFPVFFKTRFGIHTFFMKFAIDVLILDKNGRVVKIKENLKPFRILFWNPSFDQVVELPEGTIKSNQIKIDDPIKLEIKA